MDKKPDLMLMISSALAKKGKAKHSPFGKDDMPDEEGDQYDSDAHLQEIADDMMDAIENKDSSALKDLLREAFECCSMDKNLSDKE